VERLIVYVDGFNLYNGLHDAAGNRLLWLDIVRLAQLLRPRSSLVQVKYFTATVLNEPEAQARQDRYIEALRALHPPSGQLDGHQGTVPGEAAHFPPHRGSNAIRRMMPSSRRTTVQRIREALLPLVVHAANGSTFHCPAKWHPEGPAGQDDRHGLADATHSCPARA
jgi:hypothetical protein